MSRSAKKLLNRLPLLLVLSGMMGCATPRAQLSPETLLLSKKKFPLSVAIIFSSERRARVWQPDAALQGYVPRPVYPGTVLAETILASMSLIFERVFIVENEEEAVTKGADAFIAVECYVSFWWPKEVQLKDNNLVTHVKISIKDFNNATVLSTYEDGVYDHTWTAVDDGAVQRTVVAALNKALLKIAQSKEIRNYVETTRKNQSSVGVRRIVMTPKRRRTYEVNAERNYIDAPFYGLRTRVVVADFDNKLEGVPEGWNVGRRASEMLITELVKTGRFAVVERRILEGAAGEQQLEQTGLVREESVAKVGSLLGAQMMVKGVISEFKEKKVKAAIPLYTSVGLGLKEDTADVAVHIELIDVATGQVLHSHEAAGKATAHGLGVAVSKDDITFDFEGFEKTPLDQAIRSAVFDAVRFIMSKMDGVPFEANVIMIKGKSIYISAGSLMNIQVGDRLFAYTGTALGGEESRVATVEVIEVEDKFSIGQLVSGKGKLQRGDTLRFHQYQGVQK